VRPGTFATTAAVSSGSTFAAKETVSANLRTTGETVLTTSSSVAGPFARVGSLSFIL